MSDDAPLASNALHTSPVALSAFGTCVELAAALSDSGDVEFDAVADPPPPPPELLLVAGTGPPLDPSVCEAAPLVAGPVEPAPLKLLLCLLPEPCCAPLELRCALPELCCVLPELCGCVAAELLCAGCQALLCTGAGLLAGAGAGAAAGAGAGAGVALGWAGAWLPATGSDVGAEGGFQP